MSTTLNNIFGGGNKPAAPYTPPGFAPGIQGTAATPQQGGQAPAQPETPKQTAPPTPEQASQALSKAMPQVTDVKNTPKQPKRMSYEEMFKMLNPYKPPTQEELEKERKKQRREQIFAAIGDGISALSNLYFTTQYAPNMYTGMNTASQRVKQRWDKLAADRNANMKAYIDGLMKARQADDAYNKWQDLLGIKNTEAKRKADKEKADQDYKDRQFEETKRHNKANEDAAKERNEIAKAKDSGRYGGSGGDRPRSSGSGGGNSTDAKDAYNYWMSLTDNEKNQWRDWLKRSRQTRTGTDNEGNPKYSTQYMDDDNAFIQMVWKQRKAYLENHGRGDEISSGGYNRSYRNNRNLTRAGRKQQGKKSAI